MKASETKLQRILEGTSQYVVPLFQRTYSWTKKEWTTLRDDLTDLCEEAEPRNHFIGSIVTMPTRSVPEGVAKYLLIDGQQRLTTILLLLALLRDRAKEDPGILAAEIEQTLLTNPFKQGLDCFKLLPTQADRDSFIGVIRGDGTTGADGQIGKARAFFESKLRGQIGAAIEKLKSVIVSNLLLVSIVLDADDNPHLIFESLNAKGLVLTAADLIRNYFFMRIHVDRQESLYEDHWRNMQEQLGDSLSECVRHFLMKDGEIVKQGDVYFALKERADKNLRGEDQVVEYLTTLSRYADYYSKLLDPERETSPAIRTRMQRLNRIEVTTAYPFLLNIYNEYAQARISEADFAEILDILENFMIRRWVCSVPSYGLNKVFPALFHQASAEPTLVDGVKAVLRSKNYPRDDEFVDRLTRSRLYASGERAAKTKLLLECLERHSDHREPVAMDALTIEHVMPQTLTTGWQEQLGADWEGTYDELLHTLGNLTLTGYNVPLSNSPFAQKRQLLLESHIDLNKYFRDVAAWNADAIRQRAHCLAETALEVWPYFGGTDAGPTPPRGVTNRKPAAVVIFGQRIAASTWRDVAQRTFEAIAERDPEAFDHVVAQFPRYIATQEGNLREARRLANGMFMETHFSANSLYTACVQVTEAAGLSSDDWRVEFA